MKIHHVILKPVLTEKAMNMVKRNVYSFEVVEEANKYQIAEVLEKLFKVKVNKIRIVSRNGKMKRAGRKMQPKQMPNRKIAYISLKEGKIDLFPQT